MREKGSPLLEICCFNENSALIAQDSGADRIELCENYSQGGISPGIGLLEKLLPKIQIPIYCMVRPRGGNFVYSNSEMEIMRKEILERKTLGIQGFVLGILDSNRKLDSKLLKALVELANPLPITFHRAFDEVSHPELALEEIINLGFVRILTSGQKSKAWEGRFLIKDLVKRAEDRISIMPGSGIRSENILALAEETGSSEFHSSCLLSRDSEMANPMEIKNLRNLLNQIH